MSNVRSRARLRQLEKTLASLTFAKSDQSYVDRAVRAAEAGTASMAQYELLYAEDVRSGYRAMVPALVAFTRVECGPVYGLLLCLCACAYPPDQALPDEISRELKEEFDAANVCARRSITPRDRSYALRRGSSSPEQRRKDCAEEVLLFGDDRALFWRQLLWTRSPQGDWVLRPEVVAAGMQEFVLDEPSEGERNSFYDALASFSGTAEFAVPGRAA